MCPGRRKKEDDALPLQKKRKKKTSEEYKEMRIEEDVFMRSVCAGY